MRRHKAWAIGGSAVVLAAALGVYGVNHATLSALPDPGRWETLVATKAKAWFLDRAARGPLPAAPPNDAANVSAGGVLFGMGCASCHGQDGRTPTPIGKSMYPRALDLGSRQVQALSDGELFWVIKNGIRLSGMPGFARINTDEQIWQLTYYVRRLGEPRRK